MYIIGILRKEDYLRMNWMKRSQEEEVGGQGCGLVFQPYWQSIGGDPCGRRGFDGRKLKLAQFP